jgi:aminoglycoside 6'-N-acetyltransferase
MAEIAFRQIEEDDLLLLFKWLSRPHVRKWYSPQPSSFAEVAAKYRPRIEDGSPVKAFIITVGGADAGYIQAYSIDEFPEYERQVGCEKGVLGLDLFLGDAWNTRHGLGPQVIRRFVDDLLFGRYGAAVCVAGPNEGDQASIRAFEKAGFRRWKVIVNEHAEKECVLRRERDDIPYRIEPIDLIDTDVCVRFRREMYVASFGTAEGLEEEMGEDNGLYLADLREKIAQIPEGNAHLWHADAILGQLEMRLVPEEPHIGYVSLLYVAPESRRQGIGRRLHEHAAEVCRHRGKRAMRLSVNYSNVPAIMFYRKLGWEMVGPRPNKPTMAIMELALE